MIYLIILAILTVLVIRATKNSGVVVLSNWHHLFDDAKYSSQEIYTSIESALRKKEVRTMYITRTNLSEGGIMSHNREYLRVNSGEIYYDICAAPFGTGFFISWWQLYRPSLWSILISKIPFMKDVALNLTYFQADTQTMFKETVHHIVMDVIRDLGTSKGYRALTELEQRPNDLKRYTK